MKYPTPFEARRIWQDGIDARNNNPNLKRDEPYVFHTTCVAQMAADLARLMPDMDADKAYACGLLHDHGKTKGEVLCNRFHGLLGYDMLMELGFEGVAKTCLTHTFVHKNLKETHFGYPQGWLEEIQPFLDKYDYDDYDRLIQLCDKLCDGEKRLTYQERAAAIARRYNQMDGYSVTPQRQRELLEEGRVLKAYFDNKTKQDVYLVLAIKE